MQAVKNSTLVKPCHKLGVCPYGVLVELFPLLDHYTEDEGKMRCSVFGHQCPYHYVAEWVVDDGENIWEELNVELKGIKQRRGLA